MTDAQRIEDYALIGDLHTAALVGCDGSIDWLCLPSYDSPACFAALLGEQDNGHWRLAPEGEATCTGRRYRAESLVLETEWQTPTGQVRVIDCMRPRPEHGNPIVVRIVEGVSGTVEMAGATRFRFDYGHVVPWLRHPDRYVVAVAGPDLVTLRTPVELTSEDFATTARFTVRAGERVPFVMTWSPAHLDEPEQVDAEDALADTEKHWSEWIGRCTYDGAYGAEVRRSLITLKALTFAPTGGILAAATTSLPESLGGERNWDYRYCWLRDAAFSLQALLGGGYLDEARAWRHWLLRAAAGSPGGLQPMYTIYGARRMAEWTVPWLSGYAGSAPVRVGNAAADQFQLDVWGEVLAGLALARRAGITDGDATWQVQLALARFLEDAWREPDDGIWETRGERQHFVHSKVMAWSGLTYMSEAARQHGQSEDAERWQRVAEQIHDEVCDRGYDPVRNTFTQYYGSDELDASTLLLSRVGFLPADDPRILGTLAAIEQNLTRDRLVCRYGTDGDGDGLAGDEGAFLACSFWLAEAKARAGQLDEARELFEHVCGLANDVGLLAEQYDTDTGQQVGNFPQTYSHIGLITAAQQIDAALRNTK